MADTVGGFRSTDPATSVMAAHSVNVPKLEQRVLEALRGYPDGATSFELAEAMGLSLVTVSPRLEPLRRKGLVEHTGRRRRGDSGRFHTVWRVAYRLEMCPA